MIVGEITLFLSVGVVSEKTNFLLTNSLITAHQNSKYLYGMLASINSRVFLVRQLCPKFFVNVI